MNNIKLMMPIDNPHDASMAQAAGVERAFYDMEYIGNLDRRYGRNASFSCRAIDAIPDIKKELTTTQLVVRINSEKSYTSMEIDTAINYGSDVLMMPMVIDMHQVESFVKMVDGRAKVCVMIETAAALSRLTRILTVPGIDEIYVGINDLHLSMGLAFVYEPLRDGLIDYISEKCRIAGIPFGFGSIARIGDGLIPSEMILGEHVRLGSTSTLLAHTFFNPGSNSKVSRSFDLTNEIIMVREKIKEISSWEDSDFTNNRNEVVSIIDNIINSII